MLLDRIGGGANDYYSVGTSAGSMAGMTSQMRPPWLISGRGGMQWLFPWLRMDARIEIVRTFFTTSVL